MRQRVIGLLVTAVVLCGLGLAAVATLRIDDAVAERDHQEKVDREQDDLIRTKYRELCEAGNARSDLQRTVFAESRERTANFDFRSIVNLPEPERTQVAEKLKRESLEAAERNIARVPYVDCETGKRIPNGPLPPPPS